MIVFILIMIASVMHVIDALLFPVTVNSFCFSVLGGLLNKFMVCVLGTHLYKNSFITLFESNSLSLVFGWGYL